MNGKIRSVFYPGTKPKQDYVPSYERDGFDESMVEVLPSFQHAPRNYARAVSAPDRPVMEKAAIISDYSSESMGGGPRSGVINLRCKNTGALMKVSGGINYS